MSTATLTIACGACRHAFPVEVVTAVNAQRMPEAAVALRGGRLHVFACPACGAATRVRTPLVYHDMEARLLVEVVPAGVDVGWPTVEAAAAARFRPLAADPDFEGYAFRVCFGEEQLREKLALVRDGLDDRVVELVKGHLLETEAVATALARPAAALLYDGLEADGRLRFLVLTPPEAPGTPPDARVLRVTRALHDELADEPLPDEGALGALVRGPFVSVERLRRPSLATTPDI